MEYFRHFYSFELQPFSLQSLFLTPLIKNDLLLKPLQTKGYKFFYFFIIIG